MSVTVERVIDRDMHTVMVGTLLGDLTLTPEEALQLAADLESAAQVSECADCGRLVDLVSGPFCGACSEVEAVRGWRRAR